MANALARAQAVHPQNGNLALELEVAYSGLGVPDGGMKTTLNVEFPGNATPNFIRDKLSSAITSDALAQGFTVLGGDMVLPVFQKG